MTWPMPPPLQAPSPRLLHEGPRLLACHDLAGGYHEDRWAQVCCTVVRAGGPSARHAVAHWGTCICGLRLSTRPARGMHMCRAASWTLRQPQRPRCPPTSCAAGTPWMPLCTSGVCEAAGPGMLQSKGS